MIDLSGNSFFLVETINKHISEQFSASNYGTWFVKKGFFQPHTTNDKNTLNCLLSEQKLLIFLR